MATKIDVLPGMAFREKGAWIGLITLVVVYGLYFALMPPSPVAGDHMATLPHLGWFAIATVLRGMMCVGAMLVITWRTPSADRLKPDERDRTIDRRAARVAYFTLFWGMIIVGIVMPFSHQGWEIINTALLAMVIAEAVRHAIIIHSYRRGWHG